ncbi:MAG: diaminopimelate epimerase [Terriglobales bacterium]
MTRFENKSIAFTKASACGNDFLIAPGDGVDELSDLTRRLCDRHNGVGADGVEWSFADAESDVRVRLFNADGSEAEISGNGTRCVAAEICLRTAQQEVKVRTAAGVKTCRLIEKRGAEFDFESDMGRAEVGTQLAIETMWVRAVGTQVSMGNPHFVIFVEKFPEDWRKQAALIQTQPQFPQGTNVEYVVVRGLNEIEIRLFERGVGETLSSGTGSCASAVAAIAGRRVESPVKVVAPGGAQTVRWEHTGDLNQVHLRGAARLVCRGEYFL